MSNKRFEYIIKTEDGGEQGFTVEVDPDSFIIKDDDTVPGPDWTLLENNKCGHCPYKTGEKKHCPVAKNLAKASETFKDHRSYVKVTVFVKTAERSYGKSTDLQTALFSLFGLLMASSNCPHLHMFKSMARFHLPFSTTQETIVRALGMYLISEYLKTQENKDYKIGLEGLTEKYAKIAEVNKGIIERIRSLKGADANKNAVVILDSFAMILPMEISTGLGDIKSLFK